MDAPKDGVRVQATPDRNATIDIGNNITAFRAPIALEEEAKYVIGLGGPLRDSVIWVTECSGESNSLSQSTAVVKNEDPETSSEVEPGQIPRIGHVAQIKPENRPEVLFYPCPIDLRQEVVGESNNRGRTECWPIALRASPAASKRRLIDVEL